MLLKIIILLIVATNQLIAWRIFHLGRHVGGNLGVPFSKDFLNDSRVSEKYFDQYLNHFNPTDRRTWKQVFNELNVCFTCLNLVAS